MSLESTPKKPKRVGLARSKYGALISLVGIAFAFSPVGIAVISSPGGNPFSSPILWAMILTLPLGAITAGIGIVLMITGVIYTLKIKTPTAEENAETRSKLLKEKSISLALLVPVIMVTQPLITFVLGAMFFGLAVASITVFITSGLAIGAIGTSLAFAIQSKTQKFQITMIVLAVLFLAGIFLEATSLFWLIEEGNKLVSSLLNS